MSVVTRTNRATNPNAYSATNFAGVVGTGGSASGALNTDVGYDGNANFYRVTWSVATTAISGGSSYTQTGLSQNTAYIHSMYVRSSKTQTVRLTAQYKNSSSVNVGSALNGAAVALTAGSWARLSVSGTSGSAVDRVLLTPAAYTGGANWASGDTFDTDAVLIETGSVLDYFFDGGYVDGLGVLYQWTGTANASTSTAINYTPNLALLAKSDAPTDRVEITITDLQAVSQIVTLWRTADGERSAVRSYEEVEIIGSDITTDYEVPLGRSVTYDLEVLSGANAGGDIGTASITISATSGWIQDPLDPNGAVRLYGDYSTAAPFMDDKALKSMTIAADVTLIKVLGSKRPVALTSERMIQSDLSFAMVTDAVNASNALRSLLEQTPLLLIRPMANWSAALPGLCYTAAPTPQELPITEARGGTLIEWKFDTGIVEAPRMDLVIPVWTYQDWQALWSTYQGAQTAHSGHTYLTAKRSPAG